MKYLSVCSGIEAASVAWEPLGWEPVAFSEIEAFPSAVLAHHFPRVPNLGDMTDHETWSIGPGAIDLLVGGTPCVSFSVAGLRQGLQDPRGGLMLRYLAIAQRLRPRWVVWENVPGVLSSSGGRDFGAFLGALGDLGYGWAYRVLDAQYVRTHGHPRAVPQRRRRVFVVGCAGAGRRAAEVLFERESVRGNTSSRKKARQGAAGDVAGSLVSGCVSAKWAKGDGPAGDEAYNLVAQPVAFDARQKDVGYYGPISGPLDTDGTSIGIVTSAAVRRLTPGECERLQGFPDDWTLVPWRGKPASDGPRYRAIGNSMAVNCMEWIGQRIADVEERP